MTVLLSLIGEQPIPNLLPLWQFSEYTATQFAATHTTFSVAEMLQSAIQKDPQLRTVEVLPPLEKFPAYDIGQARAVLAAAIAKHQREGRQVCLNLTGGTKLMCLAALQAAFGSGIRLLYVSTEENQMITLGSDGAELERTPIQVKISVEQYLVAHGLEVGDDPSFNPHKERFAAPPPKEGDELEEQVTHLAQQSGLFDDVRRNVFIRKQTRRDPVNNELDVTVTRNGRLAVCSCKTSGKKEALREAIYELASISRREATGIYCGKLLVNDQDDLPLAIRDRARTMGVHLVYGSEIPNVAEHLRQATI